MTSAIDPTKPTQTHAYTADVRANFTAAKAEIEALQAPAAHALLVTQSVAQTIPISTTARLTFDQVLLDPAGEYDSATNYRYTPQAAGWYWTSLTYRSEQLMKGELYVAKNGAPAISVAAYGAAVVRYLTATAAGLVHLNGTTDYLEAYYANLEASVTTTVPSQKKMAWAVWLVIPD